MSAAYSGTNPRVLSGVITDDAVVAENTGSKAFENKNVGVDKTVNATGITLSGADKDNYAFDGTGTGIATINVRPITVTAQTDSRTYNGTTASAGVPLITNTGGLTSGPIMGSDVANFTQSYDNKNVDTNKTLIPSGSVDDGNDGNNYDITLAPVLTGEITKAPLTATVTVEKKVVDGTTDATIDYLELIGVVTTNDDLDVDNYGTATFDGSTVGPHDVTATGVTITGADAGNYDFSGEATGTGEILAVPTTVYVDDNWAGAVAWTDPDGAGPATYFGYDAFATIQEGIDAVADGGTVNVAAGTYAENVVIDRALTLQGQTGATIDPATGHGVQVQADDVTIDGFTITPFDGTANSAFGIAINAAGGTSGVTISNNQITTLGDNHGIWVSGSSNGNMPSTDLAITENTITVGGYADAVYAAHSNPAHSGWTISGNTFNSPAGDNIDLYDVDDLTIDDNTFGPSLDSSVIISSILSNLDGPIVFTNNNIQGNTNGSMVAFLTDFFGDDGVTTSMDDVTITGNTFSDWGLRGLRIGDGVTSVIVSENKFLGTGEALKNEDASGVNAEANWWGSAVLATVDSKIDGTVDFEPYYVESGMSILSDVPVATTYVDDNYSDGLENDGHYFGYNAFSLIQDAIEAVEDGGAVNVAEGMYPENVSIDSKSNITIKGVGDTTVVEPANGIGFAVIDSNGVTIKNLKIHTTGIDAHGIWVAGTPSGGTTVTGLTVQGTTIIVDGYSAGIYAEQVETTPHSGWLVGGTGIGNANAITINDGTGSTGDGLDLHDVSASEVSYNTITLNNPVASTNVLWTSELSDLTSLVFSNNIVSGSSGSEVAFVPNFVLGGNTTIGTITVSGNTFSNWGSRALRIGAGVSSVIASTNKFMVGDVVQILNNESTGSVNAEGNWWGYSTGPATDAVVGSSVDYRPWYTNVELTDLDSDSPTPVIASSVGALTNVSPIPVTVNFGETVTGFASEDVAVVNGTIGNFAGSGASYTFDVTTTIDGAVTVNIAANVAEDASGNLNNIATEFSIIYDSAAPTATIIDEPASLTNETSTDITVGGTNVVTYQYKLDSGTYSADIPVATHITLSELAEGVHTLYVRGSDTAGNLQAEPDTATATWTIDSTPPDAPIITSIAGDEFINDSEKAAIIIVGTAEADALVSVTISDGADDVTGIQQLADGATDFSITLDGSALSDSTITPSITAEDEAGNVSSAAVTPTASKNTVAPSVFSHTPSINAVNVEGNTITITFSEAVEAVEADITLTYSTDQSTGFTLSGSGSNTLTLTTDSLESNTVYTVTITTGVTDLAGNTIAEYDWSFTTATLYDISLNASDGGWNLISLPVVPNDKDIEVVLGSAVSSIEAVWTYDSTHPNADSSGWLVYTGNSANSNLDVMTAGYGYWISVTSNTSISGAGSLLSVGPTAPPSRSLSSGWNLVGYYQIPGESSSSKAGAFTSLGTSYTGLWGFNNSAGTFKSVGDEPDAILPGDAFWISLPEDKVYTPSNL